MSQNQGVRQRDLVDVSVIIPTYNRARLVVEAIESVLGQTVAPREIIVIDDGSTDDTPHALRSFGDRIISVRQENQGVGGARNRALAMASSRYLAFLDSDDMWLGFMLELQVGVMERNPGIGFLFSNFVITGENGKVTPQGLQTWYRHPLQWEHVFENMTVASVNRSPEDAQVRLYCGQLYRALLSEPYVLPSCAIVRSDLLTPEIRFAENDPICSDWEFFARLARSCTAGFLEIDAAVNRGGNDRPRLTHVSAAIKAEQRLRMIDAVWKADADFLAVHGREVTAVEANQCLDLARARLLSSEPRAALAALRRWFRLSQLKRWKAALALTACALIPGGGAILRGIRRLVTGVRSTKVAAHDTKQTEAGNG